MAAASPSRVKCKYWEKCYRTDEDHKKQYLHPDRSADSGKGDASPKKGAVNKPGISLKGKTVVFTGILASGTRKQATARAQAAGLIVKPTVSKVTDIIVVGEQPGKKIDLAEDKGVAVLTEEEWEELLCQSKPSKTAIGSPGKKGGACSNNSGDEESDRPSPKKRQKLNVQKMLTAAPHKVSDSDSEPDDERSLPSHGMTLRRQRTHNLSDSEDEGIADISPVKRRRSTRKPDTTDSKSEDISPPPNKAKASPNKGNVNPASPNKGKAPRCKYWENCYRKDPAHLKAFHHPPKKDAADPGEGTSASGSGSDKSTTPKHSMDVGETVDVGAYRVKRVTDHYYCTCMGWKTQPGPVNMRTCKHLKEYLGERFENNRCKGSLGTGGARSPQKSKCSIADPQLLLAQKWDEKLDPTGWWMSEKLDGVRAFWNGKGFYSRLGNAFYSPPWFSQGFPTDMTLDGELFGGRGKFQSTVSIVKTADSPQWKQLTYKVFDIPSSGNSPFEKRTEKLKKFTEDNSLPYVSIVEQTKCKGKADLKNELERVIGLGGEGVMIRQPNSQYEHRRSHTLLKFKKFYDAEARVIGHEPGKGRNSGRCGALRCEMACGKKFSCGSGLSDQDRNKPPKIGSIITYKFQEYTNDGVPRFPTYIGPRIDLNKPSDADLPAKPNDD